MTRNDIIHFIDTIFIDFCKKLYMYRDPITDKKNIVKFPYCCAQASNIVSSFLSIATGIDFRTVGMTNSTKITHFWCECCVLDLVIDITYFQFDLDWCNGLKDEFCYYKRNPSELDELLKTKTMYHYTIDEYKKHFNPFFENLLQTYAPTNLNVSPNESYSLNYESFFMFFNRYIDTILNKEDLVFM